MSQESSHTTEIATLAGGCFWCLEAVYDQLKGVEHVESGYTGGRVINPSYRQICNGDTGHAEAVQITFDPQVVSFKDLRISSSPSTTRPR
jgi:peptide-methionine (S)-S-oxide reductase